MWMPVSSVGGCSAHELSLRPLPEGLQPRIGLFVEVEHRTRTDRNVHLILKVIPYPVIGDQLVLGPIGVIVKSGI